MGCKDFAKAVIGNLGAVPSSIPPARYEEVRFNQKLLID